MAISSTGRGSVGAESLRTALALRRLIDETRRLADVLKDAAEALHQADELTGTQRRLVLDLADRTPAAVPEIARSWSVSRQHVQSLVNSLRHAGLLELVENPRHRRSKRVTLTASGRAAVGRLRGREGQVAAALVQHFQAVDLELAGRTLAALGGIMTTHFQRANHASNPDCQRQIRHG